MPFGSDVYKRQRDSTSYRSGLRRSRTAPLPAGSRWRFLRPKRQRCYPCLLYTSPYSSEEIVTRQFINGEKPTGIINIVDATNIERNLYLTMHLMELDIPMVLALNMMDEVRGNGGTVRINKMEAMLGIPVIPISAAKNEGVDELVDHALHVAKYQDCLLYTSRCV